MATVIAWSDNYEIGIEEMDEQHRKLVDLINALYTALVERSGHAAMDEVLAELVRYTQLHFAAEEKLMREANYPRFREHKAGHDRIVNRIQLFQKQFRQGGQPIGMDLLYFLMDWLTKHINEDDRAYSPHIARVGNRGGFRPFR